MGQRCKNAEDLNNLSAFLTKLTVEAALKVEMDHHLGHDKNNSTGHHSGNRRNGYSSKKLKGGHGEVDIQTPHDRIVSFVSQLIELLSNLVFEPLNQAATWLSDSTSIPSLNLTPLITLAR
ncbi:MAG: transposase [Gammaproteobacteria bacterium]|nr:transposase [Gammaproteobacteria bacterium]